MQFVEDGARLFASFGILLSVQWAESPPAPQEQVSHCYVVQSESAWLFSAVWQLPLLGPCDKVLHPAPTRAHVLELSVARSPT